MRRGGDLAPARATSAERPESTSWRTRWRLVIGGLIALQAVVFALVAMLTRSWWPGWHQGDLRLYHEAGRRLLDGARPYMDFQLEYPPGALIPFVLPHLLAPGHLDLAAYIDAFLLQGIALSTAMALALAVVAARVWSLPGAARALSVYLLVVAVGAQFLPWRYDLFPALLTLLALAGVVASLPLVAGFCLGLAVAAKLYPLVLLPVFGLAYLIERRFRALAALVAGTVAAATLTALPVLPPDPIRWLSSLGYVQERGLQIETVPAGVVLLFNALGWPRASADFTFASFHLTSPLADAILRWQPLAMVAAFGLAFASCAGRFWRDHLTAGRVQFASLVANLLLMLLVFVVTNKVFSAQHTFWLLPFAPLLPRGQATMLLGLWALTNLLFPWQYQGLIDGHLVPALLLNARNALVLALLVWLLADNLRSAWRARRAPVARPA